MNSEDILKVDNFLKNNRCMMLRIILLKMIKERSYDDILEYIENYEAFIFKRLSSDDIYIRLKFIDKSIQEIKETRDYMASKLQVFTSYKYYNLQKLKFERVKNESNN